MHDPIEPRPKDPEVLRKRYDWEAAGRWLAVGGLGLAKVKKWLGSKGG
jgi:hypothetical protein